MNDLKQFLKEYVQVKFGTAQSSNEPEPFTFLLSNDNYADTEYVYFGSLKFFADIADVNNQGYSIILDGTTMQEVYWNNNALAFVAVQNTLTETTALFSSLIKLAGTGSVSFTGYRIKVR